MVLNMKIGIGLPSHIANAPGTLTTQWARHAEQRGFDCVAAIDRLVYRPGGAGRSSGC